jgi:hypothetical protein
VSHLLFGEVPREVSLADHADEAVVGDDGHTTDAVVLHRCQDLLCSGIDGHRFAVRELAEPEGQGSQVPHQRVIFTVHEMKRLGRGACRARKVIAAGEGRCSGSLVVAGMPPG